MPQIDLKLNAMAFFDAQNLFQHAKSAFGHHHPNFDPVKLHQAVCREMGWRPTLTRFYTGIPDPKFSEMWAGYWTSRLLTLKRQGVHVTTRSLRYRAKSMPAVDGGTETFHVPQEKGIDVRIALDLVKCARKREFDVALLFSQDQDLNEVVDEVREIAREQQREIQICCPFPYGPGASYGRGIDRTEWFRMDEEFYNACIDPRDYRPRR
ncbi:MAG: NYN domain-containing protein [Minwuia sp.]|nr:NYN domain-containing protein [Minwuia sp.]